MVYGQNFKLCNIVTTKESVSQKSSICGAPCNKDRFYKPGTSRSRFEIGAIERVGLLGLVFSSDVRYKPRFGLTLAGSFAGI